MTACSLHLNVLDPTPFLRGSRHAFNLCSAVLPLLPSRYIFRCMSSLHPSQLQFWWLWCHTDDPVHLNSYSAVGHTGAFSFSALQRHSVINLKHSTRDYPSSRRREEGPSALRPILIPHRDYVVTPKHKISPLLTPPLTQPNNCGTPKRGPKRCNQQVTPPMVLVEYWQWSQ